MSQSPVWRAGACLFWKQLAARGLDRTLFQTQLGPEPELTLSN